MRGVLTQSIAICLIFGGCGESPDTVVGIWNVPMLLENRTGQVEFDSDGNYSLEFESQQYDFMTYRFEGKYQISNDTNSMQLDPPKEEGDLSGALNRATHLILELSTPKVIQSSHEARLRFENSNQLEIISKDGEQILLTRKE